MLRKGVFQIVLAIGLSLSLAPIAQAQDEWKFGIGTALTSFSVDGEIGFPIGGGMIFDVDLDNADTSDLVDSGFGLGGYAAKGKWTILYQVGTVKLEDSSGVLSAEWDRTLAEVAGVYRFARTGRHAWGVLFGARHTKHDWEFTISTMGGPLVGSLDEDWTDGIVGIAHNFPFAARWSWNNRLDAGFGDSEGSTFLLSAINWHATKHWSFYFNIKQHSIEFGDAADIASSDFYLYDVDEPGAGLGFLYVW